MKIKLFNEFTIEVNEKLFINEIIPKQPLALFEVFITRYNSIITSEELIEMFWEDSDNPLSALKFGIFRLRKALKKIPQLSKYNFIRTERGGYRFNPEVECEIDCYEFSKVYEEYTHKKEINFDNIEQMEEAVFMYQGNLFDIGDSYYLRQKGSYYRNAYLEMCVALCDFYLEHGLNEKLKEISLKAATLEPSVEDNHFYYLQSLVNTHQYATAFEYYQMIYKMLMKEYEVSLSSKLTSLYNCIVQNKDKQGNIKGIMEYYNNKAISEGAFYCDNTAFDYLYEMNMRSALRNGLKYFVLMLEIKTDSEEKRIVSLQKKLHISLQSTLRKGDVFTKLNKYQFLALIPCPDETNAFKVSQRVVRTFKKKAQRKEDGVHYFIHQARIEENDKMMDTIEFE